MATWLVLGGARSGKSARAEILARAASANPVYLATGSAGDEEMAARISQHRARRGAEWRTVEEPIDIAPVIALSVPGGAILVDCLTLWLSNLLGASRDINAAADGLVGALESTAATIVLVSNEVGLSIVPENALARQFRDAAGLLHQRVAAAVDNVDFLAAGLVLPLKRDGKSLHG